MYATEVNINELVLNLEPPTSNAEVLNRLERLNRCLKAVENWFNIYEQIPASMALGITFDVFLQLIHCIVALIRLTKLNNIPTWDTTEVRKRLDIFSLLDRIADGMEKIPIAAGVVEDDDAEESAWSRVVRGIKHLKIGTQADLVTAGDDLSTVRTKLDTIDTGVTSPAGGSANVEGQQDALMGDIMTDFGDDPWLSALFIPWDSMNF